MNRIGLWVVLLGITAIGTGCASGMAPDVELPTLAQLPTVSATATASDLSSPSPEDSMPTASPTLSDTALVEPTAGAIYGVNQFD